MPNEINLHKYFDKSAAENLSGFEKLAELALNLQWSWDHAADKIWQMIDTELWEETHNPWDMLQTVSSEKIAKVLQDKDAMETVDRLISNQRSTAVQPSWYSEKYQGSGLSSIAFFSMEFMLSDTLPIYSGGLGNVAGDLLKTASDLGVPLIGIGLLFQRGYFRQVIDAEGRQIPFYPSNNFWQLPIRPLRDENGEWLRIYLDLSSLQICLRVWQVKIGKTKLYLLDSNDTSNFAPLRGITNELYTNDKNTRLIQELILGLGGWKLLEKLNPNPQICHMNEGHTAFLVLARIESFMQKTGQSFEVARAITRAGNVFTTHTAVPAGFDVFDTELIKHYLSFYAKEKLGITVHDLLALGRQNPNDKHEKFNMGYLAIRGSSLVNGVSQLHQKVSQQLFHPLFIDWLIRDVPILSITNGVHMPSWDSAEADELWTKTCGKDRWKRRNENLGANIKEISDSAIWQFRLKSTRSLIEYLRKRVASERKISGASKEMINAAQHMFNPSALILGFARRFVSYKRPDLLLKDPDRLIKILTNTERPVQLIMAGKAHPADEAGQRIIQHWVEFCKRTEVKNHAVFLTDYDMRLAERLVQGIDVWLNTPRRPWEACGTSGMKVLVNGGINLSELDGWWAEAYEPKYGFAIGDGAEHEHDHSWDDKDAEMLYDILENQVIPEFYTRDNNDIPIKWTKRIRESMADLTPRFSSNRSMQEYLELLYLPSALSYMKRSANNGDLGAQLVNWQLALNEKWPQIRFEALTSEIHGDKKVFSIKIYLNELQPTDVQVDLVSYDEHQHIIEIFPMHLANNNENTEGLYQYQTELDSNNEYFHHKVRVTPSHPHLFIPLEEQHIAWS